MVRFNQPEFLLLLIPALLLAAWGYRNIHGVAKTRKALSVGIRAILTSFIVLALAGPEVRRPNQGSATIFLIDRSHSVPESEVDRAREFASKTLSILGPNDVGGVITFGRSPVLESMPGGKRSLNSLNAVIEPSATDIAAALRLAGATFPPGKTQRIVLISDGNETNGNARAAADALSTNGVTIDFLALGASEKRPEVAVETVQAPDEVRADQPFDLRVALDSTVEQETTLIVERDGKVVGQQRARLSAGKNNLVVRQRLESAGFHRYRIVAVPDLDTDNRNNVGSGFVNVLGRPKVLVLQSGSRRSTLSAALRRKGIDVVSGTASAIPIRASDLQQFESIIFDDLNAADLTVSQMTAMQSAVRDTGVGFAMVGGENSFLPGGYYGTPIAEMLAVDLDIRQKKSFPSTSILIVIDCSGSMQVTEDGVVKLRLAAKAAEQTVLMMSPMDRVGVAGSTDGIEFVAPMQTLANKGVVINQIRRINITGGGIYIGPSVRQAEKVLRKESSKIRHLIVIADGDDSTDFRDAISRAAGMARDKITTTVVSIGNGKDTPMLRRLAHAGRGRFFLAEKASRLPALLAQDAAIVSRSAIEEGAFLPKLTGREDILAGIDRLPPLLAYCLADTRPLSKVSMRTHKDDPLLATWQYGLGTSLAFTSDAQPRWASRWVSWEDFDAFWAQAARAIARRRSDNLYETSLKQADGKTQITLTANDRLGNPLRTTDLKVRVSKPDGTSEDVPLLQEGPGQYTGSFVSDALGSYLISVSESDRRGGFRVATSGFAIPYPPEYRTFRTNRSLLERLAERTDGQEITTPDQVLRPVPNPRQDFQEIWPFLVLAAGLLLPLDVGMRRVAIPFAEISSRVLHRLRGLRPVAPIVVAPDRLAAAKRRASTDRPQGETVTPARPNQGPGSTPVRVPPKPSSPRSVPSNQDSSTSNALLEAKKRRAGK